MMKHKLPDGWIVVNSKTHPQRVYYFNVKTNESTWDEPQRKETKSVSKKKKDNNDVSSTTPKTPDSVSKTDALEIQKVKTMSKTCSTSRDTPQMKELREKIQYRQSLGTTKKKNSSVKKETKYLKSNKLQDSAGVEANSSKNVVIENKKYTPQMLAIKEKLKKKNDAINSSKINELKNDACSTLQSDIQKNFERSRSTITTGNNSLQARNVTEKNKVKRLKKNNELSSEISSTITNSSTRCKIKRCSTEQSPRKNVAETRLKKLCTKLDSTDKGTLLSLLHNEESVGSNKRKSICLENPSDIYKNSASRMQSLREKLKMQRLDNHEKFENNDSIEEEMDWEEIPEERIIFDTQTARTQVFSHDGNISQKLLPQNSLEFPRTTSKEENLYMVIDTNVFLTNLHTIEIVRDTVFKKYGRPIIVVPWTVIKELDYIKDSKNESKSQAVQLKARQAINFLNKHFSAKHPRVVGQKPEDVIKNKEKFAIDCPDDEILQTCLQIQEFKNHVVLLSYDQNLCNKAMIHDVIAIGRNDPLEKIDYLVTQDRLNTSCSLQLKKNTETGNESLTLVNEEKRIVEDVFQNVSDVLNSFLTVVVSREMRSLYGDNWDKYTIIPPPWTVQQVLKCAIKHWIAAISESFIRKAEPILKQLHEDFNNFINKGFKIIHILPILDRCYDLIQTAKVEKYGDLIELAFDKIQESKNICKKFQLEMKSNMNFIGTLTDEQEQIHSERAFQYFQKIYEYARDRCGLVVTAAGLPCNFGFEKPNKIPSVETLRLMQTDLANNINKLLFSLMAALEKQSTSSLDEPTLNNLRHVLANFLPSDKTINADHIMNVDLYCCLKRKEEIMRAGVRQLQELSSHFCSLHLISTSRT